MFSDIKQNWPRLSTLGGFMCILNYETIPNKYYLLYSENYTQKNYFLEPVALFKLD